MGGTIDSVCLLPFSKHAFNRELLEGEKWVRLIHSYSSTCYIVVWQMSSFEGWRKTNWIFYTICKESSFQNRSRILLYSSHPHPYGRGITINCVTSKGLYQRQSASEYDDFSTTRYKSALWTDMCACMRKWRKGVLGWKVNLALFGKNHSSVWRTITGSVRWDISEPLHHCPFQTRFHLLFFFNLSSFIPSLSPFFLPYKNMFIAQYQVHHYYLQARYFSVKAFDL
jgi:hypothetical protein